jgi:hypothetical protein
MAPYDLAELPGRTLLREQFPSPMKHAVQHRRRKTASLRILLPQQIVLYTRRNAVECAGRCSGCGRLMACWRFVIQEFLTWPMVSLPPCLLSCASCSATNHELRPAISSPAGTRRPAFPQSHSWYWYLLPQQIVLYTRIDQAEEPPGQPKSRSMASMRGQNAANARVAREGSEGRWGRAARRRRVSSRSSR